MSVEFHINVDHGGLKVNRELEGLSLEELAEKTGIDVETLRKYEDGTLDLNQASLLTLLKICKALGCEISNILTDPETFKAWDRYIDEDDDDEEDEEEDDCEEEKPNNQSVKEILKRVEKALHAFNEDENN